MKSLDNQLFRSSSALEVFIRRILAMLFVSFLTVQIAAAATISSTTTGGNWADVSTWVGGVVPTSTDDVIIVSGATVVVRSPYTLSPLNPATCNSLTVDGTLIMGIGSGGSRSLQVSNSLIISSGGVVTNDEVTLHRIGVGGDFINDGTFNSLVGAGSIQLVLNGTGAQLIDGTPTSQSFEALVIDKTAGQVSPGGSLSTLQINSFTLAAGEFMAPAVLNIKGNFINNSSSENNFKAGTGTVFFNGTTQSIGGSTHTIFNHLTTVTGTTLTTNRKVTVGGNLLIADGTTLNVGGFDFTVSGTTTIGEGTSGFLTFTSTTGTKTFSGHVLIYNEATWDNTIGENIFLNGGITNNPDGNFISGNGTYYFEVNSQTISGNLTFFDFDVRENITVTNSGSITILDSFAGLGTFVQGPNATVTISGSSTIATLDASSSGNTVHYNGAAQNLKGINYVNLTLSGTDASHVKTLSGATSSIAGNFTLNGSASSYTVTNLVIGGDLTLTNGANFTMEGDNVTVNGYTTIGENSLLDFLETIGIKTFKGPVINNGTWDNPPNESILIEGGLTNNGTFNSGTGIYNFATNSQSINGTVAITNIQVEAARILTNNGTVMVDALTGLGTFAQGNNATLNISGSSTIASLTASAAGNTVNYTGAAQTVYGINYVNLGLSGSGEKTLQAGTTSITGNLNLDGTATISTVGNITVGGDLSISANAQYTNNHTTTANGKLLGAGTLAQTSNAVLFINGESTLANMSAAATDNIVHYHANEPGIISGSYFNLMLNQMSGTAVLLGNLNVGGTLTLSTGSLMLEDYNLLLESDATLSIASPSASRMIITSGDGELRKKFNAVGSFTYPVGEETGTTEFTPITVDVTSAAGFNNAYVGVTVVDGKHPSNNSTTNFLTRYWTVTQAGITDGVASLAASYLNDDISGSEGNIIGGQLLGDFDLMTNGWKRYTGIGSNTLSITGASLGTQPSYVTGINNAVASVTITGGDGPAVCVGTEVSLNSTVDGELPITYVWTPASGLSATNIGNPVAKPSETTTYTLTIYDANGSSASDQTVVTTQQPSVIVNSLSFCNGSSGVLTAAGATSYEWSPAAGLSATTGESVTANPTETTTYRVIGTDANSCTDSAYAVVTVIPLPAKPVITASDLNTETPKLTSSSDAGNQWYKNGVLIPGATNKVLTVTTDGSYTVEVTTNGCTGPLSDAYTIVIVGFDEEAYTKGGLVYPNPASDILQFDKSKFVPGEMIEVKIYDLTGRVISNQQITTDEAIIHLKSLAKGPHLFVAQQNNVMVVQKFIKN